MHKIAAQNIIVIVTTYNRPDALELVLSAYLAQTDHNFALIIADDGSTIETAQLIQQYQGNAPFSLTHIWQDDYGFRAATVRNRALATLSRDCKYYVIFTDGDCIPRPDFIAQHRKLAEPGWFVSGNRILLSENFTLRILENPLPIYAWCAPQWFYSWLRRDINRFLPLIKFKDSTKRKAQPQRWQGAKTCNLAVWWSDLIRINGFDESYLGWGLEDSDLVIRLLHSGAQHKNGRFAIPVFHLWHKENTRARLNENQHLLDELSTSNRIRARKGLEQYLFTG